MAAGQAAAQPGSNASIWWHMRLWGKQLASPFRVLQQLQGQAGGLPS